MVYTFLLIVMLQSNPNVIFGVDGEYKTMAGCEAEKEISIKKNPKYKKSIRCIQIVMDPEDIKVNKQLKEMKNTGKGTM